MRLFLIGLWVVLFASGCKGTEDPKAGALRVELSYATFRPGCLKLTAADKEDPARSKTEELRLGTQPAASRELLVAVFREEGWSRELVLTATAYERACVEQDPRPVDTQTVEAQVPEKGVVLVKMSLRAEDLDDDGYVRSDQGGSDCDDDNAQVNPRAAEDCDGVDDNCSGDERDAAGAITYSPDADGDGYGDRTPGRQTVSCLAPPGHVTNNRDCNDLDATIHPDQAETLCNGQDENCDDVADDTFNVGAPCSTSLTSCPGIISCFGPTIALCVGLETPSSWYVDRDGDQRAGTAVALSCVSPEPGAVTTPEDCNDSSRFAFTGGTERCDRLDNDCNGQVDELGECATKSWQSVLGAGTSSTRWNAVAAYAEGKAWLAGSGDTLAHVEQSTATTYTDCPGNWQSAWARGDGRVFLGSDSGVLATRLPTDTGCETVSTGQSVSINGLVGFESGASTLLFAVASDGRIYRWDSPGTGGAGTVTQLARVAANLRDVHGTSPTNLLAVGAETVGTETVPRVFHSNGDGTVWTREELPDMLPANIFLRGVHMVHSRLAHAAGDAGVLLAREEDGVWRELRRLAPGGTPTDIQDMVSFGRTVIYAAASNKEVYVLTGGDWSSVYESPRTPFAIDGVRPDELWTAGTNGSVARWAL